MLSISCIFKIRENYLIVLIKIMRRKQSSIINQCFSCKHKINESYAKVTTHCWIICMYTIIVCFYVFIFNKLFNFFRNLLNTKAIKMNNFFFFTKKSNPMCTSICMLIKIYYVCPILYFFRFLNYVLQKHQWNLVHSHNLSVFQNLLKDEAVLKNHFISITSSYNSFSFFIFRISFYSFSW